MEKRVEAINMDSYESLDLDRTSSTSNNVERLKRMVKFIVSICVFSLVLALFFSFFSLFPHSFTVYFSTFLFSLLSHGMERKFMFLICNGILFLLATSSVLQDSSPPSSSSSFGYSSFSHSVHHDQFEHDLVAAASDGYDSDESEHQNQEHEEQEEEHEQEDEEDDEDEEDEGCFTEEVEEEEEEEEEAKRRDLEVVVSTEELNKKIEEFIRKMKEEMRIEAAQTQQLIAV